MTHTNTRLEKNGVVVAYLAEQTQVDANHHNDLRVAPRVRDRDTIARDLRLVVNEIGVHGHFIHSDDLPAEHRTALNTLFGALPVTPEQQFNRIVYYANKVGGPFEFYRGNDSYTAKTAAAVDFQAGVYPAVQIQDLRGTWHPSQTRATFFLKLVSGLESNS